MSEAPTESDYKYPRSLESQGIAVPPLPVPVPEFTSSKPVPGTAPAPVVAQVSRSALVVEPTNTLPASSSTSLFAPQTEGPKPAVAPTFSFPSNPFSINSGTAVTSTANVLASDSSVGAPSLFNIKVPAPAPTPAVPALPVFSLGSAAPKPNLFSLSTPGAPSMFSIPPLPPAPSADFKDENGEDDGEGGNDEGEPILEPEKILPNAADTDEYLYEAVCKLFRFNQEDKEWKDAGKGTLKISKEKDTGKQRILIRDPMGKLSLNCYFYPGMKFDKLSKKSIKFLAPSGPNGELRALQVTLKPENIDQALDMLQKGEKSVH